MLAQAIIIQYVSAEWNKVYKRKIWLILIEKKQAEYGSAVFSLLIEKLCVSYQIDIQMNDEAA